MWRYQGLKQGLYVPATAMKCYTVLFPSILEINAFDVSHKQPRADKQRPNTDLVSDLQFLYFKPSENQLPQP